MSTVIQFTMLFLSNMFSLDYYEDN